MTWQTKIKILKNALPERENLRFVFDYAKQGAPEDFISDLRRQYPFVPESYVDLLRLTDGLQLDYFTIFGSGQSPFPSLSEANHAWRRQLEASKNLVVAEDASGSAFVLRDDAKIFLISTEAPEEQATFVAWSFDDLLDEVFMGPRYLSLFPYGPRPDNDWLTFLLDQRWIV